MPEEHITETDLERVLDHLEDYNLNSKNYEALQNALDSVDHISTSLAEKLLNLCVRDKIEDLKYTAHVINIISSLLKKIKEGNCSPLPNLVPSALAVLNILKTTALFSKVEALKTLCFEIIISYPNEPLITLTVNYAEEIYELINLYCHQLIPPEIRIQPIYLIEKILRIVPPDKRTIFVRDGIKVWFSKVIPIVVEHLMTSNDVATNIMDALEMLTEDLVIYDYANNPAWLQIFEHIHSHKKYPAKLKDLLYKHSDIWHRLWIMFVKLLKGQITKCLNTNASAINSLLPCVEHAFKMDITNRCRAFKCWNVLIDCFSKETIKAILIKRLKLLIVPLLANNAKVEETALAKIDTWCHLMYCFQDKLDTFLEKVVIQFLYFSFGKPFGQIFVPGKISQKTEIQCVKAFINIVGHTECDGCVSYPKHDVNMFKSQLFVNHWKDWFHSLSSAIQVCVANSDDLSELQIKCVWKSFIIMICDMDEYDIRHELFNQALVLLEELTQKNNNRLMGVVVNILIPTLFEGNGKMETLLKPKKDHQDIPVLKILSLLSSLPLDSMDNERIAIERIKSVTNYVVEDAQRTTNDSMALFVNILSGKSFFLWTAFAESICTYNFTLEPLMLSKMLLWPFKFMENFVKNEHATTAWLHMYKDITPYLETTSVYKEIIEKLRTHSNDEYSYVFVLSASFVMLEQKLQEKDFCLDSEIEMIVQLTSKINVSQIILIIPSLSEVIIHLLDSLHKNINIALAEKIILMVNNTIKKCNVLVKAQHSNVGDVIKYVKKIFDSLESILELDSYSELKSQLLHELVEESATYLTRQNSLICNILANQEISLNKNISEQNIKEIIIENQDVKNNPDIQNFVTPNSEIGKKSKKEASIINTVVENGEEFVVVKSNWKFNPRKLTDNQKEKLQRKREDIPALYQDLSQSQDEFKLITWKTESQDTSNTLSKSTNLPNDDVSTILKNIPKSEFVPKIIENVIMKEIKQNSTSSEVKLNNTSDKLEHNNKSKYVQNPIKGIKSPRMSLKDRVFRNVRNLMGKSDTGQVCKDVCSDKSEYALKKSIFALENLNSESQINLERPSRIKRKPRKFDDVEIYSLKKRRRSVNSNELESQYLKTNIAIGNQEKADNIDKNGSIEIQDTRCKGINIFKQHENDPILEEKDNATTVESNEIIHNSVKNDIYLMQYCKQKSNLDVNNLNESTEVPLIDNQKVVENSCIDKENNSAESTAISTLNNVRTNSHESTNNVSETEEKAFDDTINKIMSENEVNKITEYKAISASNKQLSCDDTINDIKKKPLSTDIQETTDKQSGSDVAEFSTVPSTPTVDDIPVSTPKVREEWNVQKSTNKKIKTKKSRIENQLAIDMVEGHPYLNVQSEKRLRRKTKLDSPMKRKTLTPNADVKTKCLFKKYNKTREKEKYMSFTNSQINESTFASQDIIESSQDSTVSTMSKKSLKPFIKKPIVVLECLSNKPLLPNILDNTPNEIDVTNRENNSDTELSCNRTNLSDLTEDLDTEPIDHKSDAVESGDDDFPITVISVENTLEQNTANADTQIVDTFLEQITSYTVLEVNNTHIKDTQTIENISITNSDLKNVSSNEANTSLISTSDDIITPKSESLLVSASGCKQDVSSPCNSNEQRKKDFLHSTVEISPIKTLSPVRDQKSPSPETSSDYVVIKLTSPVHCNGEPFEKSDSPEIFTDDKVSPDKRDQSPPREEIIVTNTSPSSSLSLKKNRPQVRTGGRAAQMLGLCVSNRLQTNISLEKVEFDEAKRNPSQNTSARRNLRILYSNVENNDYSDANEDSENFLKFKRIIPATDCSPSGPILKRKLMDIADEATASPASKRKRVSFHDPPVSTTICVKKYIEPISIRSPQNSAIKRLERQTRAQVAAKSPRRLDNVFKLDSVLNKAVESFSVADTDTYEDTEMSSMDETPIVEVVKNSDLNDTDPICEELVDCKDHILNIAADLSSPTMKSLLIKTFDGNVETIGDLAKMTELEINRLCIKAPKVHVAKKVLNNYLAKLKKADEEITPTVEAALSESTLQDHQQAYTSVEVQTYGTLVQNIDIQTESVAVSSQCSQTEAVLTIHRSLQTEESGSKPTTDIIANCISERPDFLESLCVNLDKSSKQRIIESLPLNAIIAMVLKRLSPDNFRDILISLLEESKFKTEDDNECKPVLSILEDHLVERYESNNLVLFCSNLLKKVYKKSL